MLYIYIVSATSSNVCAWQVTHLADMHRHMFPLDNIRKKKFRDKIKWYFVLATTILMEDFTHLPGGKKKVI